jgi:hypothetical protein
MYQKAQKCHFDDPTSTKKLPNGSELFKSKYYTIDITVSSKIHLKEQEVVVDEDLYTLLYYKECKPIAWQNLVERLAHGHARVVMNEQSHFKATIDEVKKRNLWLQIESFNCFGKHPCWRCPPSTRFIQTSPRTTEALLL